MKRRLYPFFLLAVFLLGCVGHLLSRPKTVEEVPYTATFYLENVNSLLLYSLPKEGDVLRFLDTSGRLLRLSHEQETLYERDEGRLLSSPSLLHARVTLRLSVFAHEKDGRLYLGEKLLTVGEEVVLSGENFSVSAHFGGAERDF